MIATLKTGPFQVVQINKHGDHPDVSFFWNPQPHGLLKTDDGLVYVKKGDYVLTDANGRHAACPRNLFHLLFNIIEVKEHS